MLLKKSKLVMLQVVQQVISNGNDIARSMVCNWGMSDLGMISFGDKQDQVFLGKELSRAQNYSEETAQKIDIEIKSVIDNQYKRAKTFWWKDRCSCISSSS